MVICIVGPTGVGKTKLSVELAKIFNGEVINADSTQVYKTLDIATAKVRDEEKFIPHSILADHFGLKSGFVGNSSSGLKLFRGTELVGYCNNDIISIKKDTILSYY